MSTTARPRSLADDLRLRSQDAIAHLLATRPDLLTPVPESLSQLAMRAASAPSVRMALHHVDGRTLVVAQAIASEPVTTDPATLAERIGGGAADAVVDHGLKQLHDLGLLWHDGQRYLPVRELAGVTRTVVPEPLVAPTSERAPEPAVERTQQPQRVDQSAGLHGHMAVGEFRRLLQRLATLRIGVTREGVVAARDLRMAATAMKWTTSHTAMLLELGWLAGLLGPSPSALAVLPTQLGLEWLEAPDDSALAVLVDSWWTTDRDWAQFDDEDSDDRPAVFGGTHVITTISQIRKHWWQCAAAAAAGITVGDVDEVLLDAQPLAWHGERVGKLRHHLQQIVMQADYFGVSSHGALSTLGRALGESADATELARVASEMFPAIADRIIVQGDLTIIAPTPLPRELADTLAMFTDIESTGGATVYRLNVDSLTGGLAAGLSADDMVALLRAHSDVPIPQSVEFLITDTAASHGRIRIGAASSYLATEDAVALNVVIAALGPQSSHVDRLSDTVAVADLDPATLSAAARGAGFPVAGEAGESLAALVAPPPVVPGTVHGVAPQRISAVLELLFAAPENQPTTDRSGQPEVERMHSAQIQALLTRASSQGTRVWLRYADNAGASTVRRLGSVNLVSGAVEAVDVDEGRLLRFALPRIVGVRIASEDS